MITCVHLFLMPGVAMAWFDHMGSRIWYEEQGQGTPVLLLPGFSDRILHYTQLRDALSSRNRVIAADLPGSGRSLPQPRSYDRGYYDEDATSFLALLGEIGALPAHVLGHSDGGETALVMAVQSSRSVRSLLTWGATGYVEDPRGAIDEFFSHVIDAPKPGQENYRQYLIETYGEATARAMTQSFAAAMHRIEAEGGDICRSRAGVIACPTLLLHGANEAFFDFSLTKDLAAAIPGAIVEKVAGAGHGIHEDRPEWFLNRIRAWLEAVEQQA